MSKPLPGIVKKYRKKKNKQLKAQTHVQTDKPHEITEEFLALKPFSVLDKNGGAETFVAKTSKKKVVGLRVIQAKKSKTSKKSFKKGLI